MEYHWLQTYMRKTSKGKIIVSLNDYDLLIMIELILTKNLMGKYEEKLYPKYLLKNSGEKTEDMIYVICLEYPLKNPGGENLTYDIEYCLIKNLCMRKTLIGKLTRKRVQLYNLMIIIGCISYNSERVSPWALQIS